MVREIWMNRWREGNVRRQRNYMEAARQCANIGLGGER